MTKPSNLTMLTFDAVAQMAYLYLATPGAGNVVRTRHTSFGGGVAGPMFSAGVDCDAEGRSVGVEFAAATRGEALRRAVEVEANVA